MDEEKRMIENYEVRHSVYLGDREILFGVDKDAAMPYLVSDCTDLGGFGLLRYERLDLPDAVDVKDVEILEFTEESQYEKENHSRTQGADQAGKTPLLHGGSLLGRLLRFCHTRFGGRR